MVAQIELIPSPEKGGGHQPVNVILKVAVSRDFLAFFYFMNQTQQSEIVLLKNSFSRRYSNFKLENFDSAQANTARSPIFFDKLAH